MPTVSVANFESEDLLSSRLLSFMANNDQPSIGCENVINGTKFVNSGSFGSSAGSLVDGDISGSSVLRSPLHRNGSTSAAVTLHDRLFNGSPSDLLVTSNSTGYMSGSCTPPPSSVHSISSVPANFLPVRNHAGAPPYSALTSPCLTNKLNPGANVQQLLGYNGGGVTGDCHSLQNSPFYNHYPLNGNLPNQLHRQLGGLSPGPIGPLIPNGVNALGGPGLQSLGTARNGLYQDLAFPLGNNLRSLNPNNPGCPQRELFPTANHTGVQCNSSIIGSGLLMQDRLHYYALAQKHGFIVGAELERVKENSCRSTSQSYGRIAAHFRHRYGETEAKTKATYLQIGVRVPSKDHVSEIVGKGGQKIKLIREETGALITTPGEHEEHVFIIEAPPEIALRVAHHLTARAQEITQSKLAAGERRRGSTSSQASTGLDSGLSVSSFNTGNNLNGTGSTNSLLAVNTTSSCTTSVLPLSSSVTNSPLHPAVSVLSTTILPPGASSINTISTNLRTPNGSLFSPHLGSLPSSPCNSTSLNGIMGSGAQGNGGPGGNLFLGTNTSGSRLLLARGRISVPQDMVGKIIGTQGSIITTIQKDTGTEIKSPPKEAARGPNATSEFEISAYQGLGLSSNQAAECRVQQAKQLIGHLVMRQLERRASEEVDDASGGSSNLSSDEQRHASGNGGTTPRTAAGGWMWPDVAQMDSQEAREVLDRILAESKNKTRRAKELAAAAAVSAGPSPTNCQTNPTSVLVSQSHLGGMLTQEQQQQQSHFHLMGAAGLFDHSDSNDCNDLTPHDMTQSSLTDTNGTVLFNPQSNQSFCKRNSSNALGDDLTHNGFSRAGQPCSPRALSGFKLSDPTDLLGSLHRTPGNLGTDIWSCLSGYGTAGVASVGANATPLVNRLQCDAVGANQLRSLLGSGSANVNQSVFHSSPPPPCGSDTSLLRKQTSLTNGFGGVKPHFGETNVFNFSDSVNGLSSGFASSGDLSPTLLLQHCRAPGADVVHQPLTRRHSDWMVNSPNALMMMDMSISRCGGTTDRQTSCQLGLVSEATTHACENGVNSFNSPGGFDFLKALDQLCLNSGTDGLPDVATSSHTNSGNGFSQACPPGFEQQPASLLASEPCDTTISDLCTPWSNTNTSHSNALFHSPHFSDSCHSNPVSRFSLLQRLFHHSPSEGVSTGHLNSIWSSSSQDPIRNIPITDDEASYHFPSCFDDVTTTHTEFALGNEKSDSLDMFHTISSSDNVQSGASPSDSSRCGAIGEGRRRGRARGSSPSSSASLSNEVESIVPISVASVITSITEVA